jgi:hypothetical protein
MNLECRKPGKMERERDSGRDSAGSPITLQPLVPAASSAGGGLAHGQLPLVRAPCKGRVTPVGGSRILDAAFPT